MNLDLEDLPGEVWKQLREHPSYQISNHGRVKSFCYDKISGRILKARRSVGMVYCVSIYIHQKKTNVNVHQLVARYFMPPAPEKDMVLIHKDWDYANNHVSNLKWVTLKQQFERVSATNEHFRNTFIVDRELRLRRDNKITASDAVAIREMLAKGVTGRRVAKIYNISEMQVTRIRRRENWANAEEGIQKAS